MVHKVSWLFLRPSWARGKRVGDREKDGGRGTGWRFRGLRNWAGLAFPHPKPSPQQAEGLVRLGKAVWAEG